jgi:hypothetical protein
VGAAGRSRVACLGWRSTGYMLSHYLHHVSFKLTAAVGGPLCLLCSLVLLHAWTESCMPQHPPCHCWLSAPVLPHTQQLHAQAVSVRESCVCKPCE